MVERSLSWVENFRYSAWARVGGEREKQQELGKFSRAFIRCLEWDELWVEMREKKVYRSVMLSFLALKFPLC